MAAASLSQDGQSNEFSSTSMKIEESPGSDSIEELDKAMASSKSTKDPIEWTPDNLEKLRLCRNRAYAKVNTKRRQHLPASLSSFLLREWQASTSPSECRKVSAKYLLGVYVSNFESGDKEKKRLAASRKRGRKDTAAVSLGPEAREANKASGSGRCSPLSQEDHADKQWSEAMLANLLECGAKAQTKLHSDDANGRATGGDLSAQLLEEWLKIYPRSTLTSRNLKSRLTVYSKTRLEVPPPSKRRKVTPQPDFANHDRGEISRKEEPVPMSDMLEAMEKLKAQSEDNPNSVAFVMKLKENLAVKFPSLKDFSDSAFQSYYAEALGHCDQSGACLDSQVQNGVLDEISDEFVPEPNDEPNDEMQVDQANVGCAVEDNRSDVEEEDKVCEKHWMHMFHDDDKSVECILTDQMLEVRQRLEASFPGCDLYHPKKPKGFSSMVLKEWKRSYPNSEENIKSISVKFAKYDKMPSGGLNSNEVEKNDSGRINWGPALLNNLQKARKIAVQKCGNDSTPFKLNRAWKKEWNQMYPHLDVEWRTVINRYQYHFGGLQQSSSSGIGSLGAADRSSERGKVGTLDASPDEKVKGFRNWTAKTKSDLLGTKKKIVESHADLEPGSSQFNRLLLQEFQKLHPKCMESSRSIYAKVQSLEKDESNVVQPKMFEGEELPIGEKRTSAKTAVGKRISKTSVDLQMKKAMPVIGEEKEGSEDTEVKEEKIPEGEMSGNLSPTLQSPYKDEPGRPNLALIKTETEDVSPVVSKKLDFDRENDVKDENVLMASKGNGAGVREPSEIKYELNIIEGFENWSLFMIRDFIACMDTARRKYATLKEADSDGSIKLVPLLLQEWQKIYPQTTETVKTFHVKIKHLKLQKEVIKRHLEDSKLLPKKDSEENDVKEEAGEDIFRWNKSMMQDVISSRKRALELKDKGCAEGKKLSFHQLWASEFKKIHPKSTYTSNNLSVHFWTWRKQQQKLGKVDPLYDDSLALADTSRPPQAQHHQQTGWTPALLKELEKLGKGIQRMLRNPDTPAAKKGQGFATLLHTEWLKRYPRRGESIRALNMCYVRQMKKSDVPSSKEKSHVAKTNWHPKQNRILRECVRLHNFVRADISESEYTNRIIEDWRDKLPDVHVTDDELKQRIQDLEPSVSQGESPVKVKDEPGEKASDESRPGKLLGTKSTSLPVISEQIKNELHPQPSLIQSSRSSSPAQSLSNTLPAEGTVRGPNARGQMCWNKQTIRDLFDAHQVGLQRRKEYLTTLSKRDAPLLSKLVLEEFLKLHPYCKLSPSILMAKCYCWKNAVNKGTLSIDMHGPLKPSQAEEKQRPLHSIRREAMDSSVSEATNCMKELTDLEKIAGRLILVDTDDPVFGHWRSETLNDMLTTRLEALRTSAELAGDKFPLDIWYDHLVKLHPGIKHSKRILWKKYEWFRTRGGMARLEEPNGMYDQQFAIAIQAVRNRSIRKDIFLHIKALMEEARIFLPQKLPADDELRGKSSLSPLSGMTMTTTTFGGEGVGPRKTNPDSHECHPPGQLPIIESGGNAPLNLSVSPRPTASASVPERSSEEKKDSIKLPGGATLVAVTDRNADTLLKPKPIEKPNVTITIGEKKEGLEQQLAQPSPPIVLPINIPTFPHPAPPRHPGDPSGRELDPSAKVGFIGFIPARVRARLEELSLSDTQFVELLEVYDQARFEYIDTLKRGFLTFFPFVVRGLWKMRHPESIVTGRKLQTLIELYIDEKIRGGRVQGSFMPEYLTKKPCQFVITEQLLKTILLTHVEAKRGLEERFELVSGNDSGSCPDVSDAMIYVEMCKLWSSKNPNMRMTNKQLISIHQMLTYDPAKILTGSPEVECTLADIWKAMEKAVVEAELKHVRPLCDTKPLFVLAPKDESEDGESVEVDNLSMDQVQEWVLAAQNVRRRGSHKVSSRRPRFVTKHLRKFWSHSKLEDLSVCRVRAINRKAWNTASPPRQSFSIMELMHREWKRLYPEKTSRLSKFQVVAQCIKEIRREKQRNRKFSEKSFKAWRRMCDEFTANEDLNQTVREDIKKYKEVEEEETSRNGSALHEEDFASNADELEAVGSERGDKQARSEAVERNYHNDEHVLDYIRDLQRKGNVTWTADMIKSLMQARTKARNRKKQWEAWAIKEYGGVGYAYNNPDVKFQKVDEMFLEEWKKARPEHASLSIWTLNAYARKYDNLKKQLIIDHGQGADASSAISMTCTERTTHSPVFYQNSGIPKFNLEDLDALDDLEEDIKLLIKTRQLAMERRCKAETEQGSEAKYRLAYLWEQEWRDLTRTDANQTGSSLQKRLYAWESDPANRAQLKPALVKAADGDLTTPTVREDEVPVILPRRALYPSPYDGDEFSHKFNVLVHINASVGKKGLVKERKYYAFHRDLYSETEAKLNLPAVEVVEAECVPVDEDGVETSVDEEAELGAINPPRSVFEVSEKQYHALHMNGGGTKRQHGTSFRQDAKEDFSANKKGKLICDMCRKEYHNVNNLRYHHQVHTSSKFRIKKAARGTGNKNNNIKS